MTQGYQAMTRGYPAMTQGYPAMTRGYPAMTQGYPAMARGYPAMTQSYPATTHNLDLRATTQNFGFRAMERGLPVPTIVSGTQPRAVVWGMNTQTTQNIGHWFMTEAVRSAARFHLQPILSRHRHVGAEPALSQSE